MAIKTFTTGEVLTASDTNTYLANSGLVYINQASFSGAVSGTFDNVFTDTYDAYKIVVNNSYGNSNLNSWYLRFINDAGTIQTANYYSTSYGQDFASGTTGFLTFATTIGVYLGPITNGAAGALSFDVFNARNASQPTNMQGQYTAVYSGSQYSGGTIYGWHTVNQKIRGFVIYNNGGGALQGTVRIYGYRQA